MEDIKAQELPISIEIGRILLTVALMILARTHPENMIDE